MKANEAPEKIYFDGESKACKLAVFSSCNIEYVRTDAFLHKAAIWLNNNFVVHNEFSVMSNSFTTTEEMYEDFVKYMKGE